MSASKIPENRFTSWRLENAAMRLSTGRGDRESASRCQHSTTLVEGRALSPLTLQRIKTAGRPSWPRAVSCLERFRDETLKLKV